MFDTNSVNTHIDCFNYKITVSLCKSILKATKQGNQETIVKELASVPLHLFLLDKQSQWILINLEYVA